MSYLIADTLLYLLWFRETSLALERPNHITVGAYLKYAASGRHKGYLPNLRLECGQQLLRYPRSPEYKRHWVQYSISTQALDVMPVHSGTLDSSDCSRFDGVG